MIDQKNGDGITDSLNQPTSSQVDESVTRILFVCYANICRSPMAEAIMGDLIKEAGLSQRFIVDSAGTQARVGEAAYKRSLGTLQHYGVLTRPGLSRQLEYDDLNTFDYILAMDRRNFAFILQHSRGCSADVRLFLTFANQIGLVNGDEVHDPFPDGDYDLTYRVIRAGCKALLRYLESR